MRFGDSPLSRTSQMELEERKGHIGHFYKLGDAHRGSGTLPAEVSVAGPRLESLLPDSVFWQRRSGTVQSSHLTVAWISSSAPSWL